MNIKEQESQLTLNLNLRIVVSIIAFLILVGFMAFRLFATSLIPKIAETTSNTSVPSLKLVNFETLRQSIKISPPTAVSPITRPEPFD